MPSPTPDTADRRATVSRAAFGTLPDGRAVESFTLANGRGVEITAITYGAILTAIRTPDRAGRFDDVVLGFDSLDGYLAGSPYFGAVVGRYANRIARGRFTLDGATYELATNNGPNALHGGIVGFDKVVWTADAPSPGGDASVTFRHTSPDGDEGYPGELTVGVTYTLTSRDELVVDYEASTTKATPLNLSQHSYWNLTGSARRDVLGHVVTLDASAFTPVDATLIPTGVIAPVAGTPFDFRVPAAVGARIAEPHEQLAFAGGYDHNWVLDRGGQASLVHAARVVEPESGRTLDVATTEPGVQFYSGNFLDGTLTGKAGRVYGHRYGLCLETQHYPDSPNHPAFPSTIVRPGDAWRSRTVFAFGVAR